MRILHVANKLSSRGNGIVNLAVDIAIEQSRAGHHVAFIAAIGGHEDLVTSEGITVFPVDQRRTLTNLPRAFAQIGKALIRFKPDVIHAHMQTGMFLCLPWAKLLGIRVIGHLHNVHDKTASRMAMGDRLITVSEAVRETMLDAGVPDQKMRVVLNGTVRSPRVPLHLKSETLAHPAILTVGGMHSRKGISDLIVAFTLVHGIFPAAKLYIVGEGPEGDQYALQARESTASESIHFLGFRPNPQTLMRAADIFVLASHRDSCPLVLSEAREAGCAIVASDVDGIPEALDFGKAGILVPPQNPAELSRVLSELLGNPICLALWRTRASCGLNRFTAAEMAEKVVAAYN